MRLIEFAYANARRELEFNWKEIPGQESNPKILEVYKAVDGLNNIELNDDEVAWCSCFANWCVQRAGGRGTRSAMARSWLNWGLESDGQIGDIVVLKRGNSAWQGHVGFLVKKDLLNIQVLGGNQSNTVNIQSYPKSSVLGYRTSKDIKEQLSSKIIGDVKMKETKEALVGMLAVAKEIALLAKDGAQVQDAVALFAKLQEPELKAKVDAAIADVQKVQEELKVASAAEYFDLLIVALPELKALVEAIQKKA